MLSIKPLLLLLLLLLLIHTHSAVISLTITYSMYILYCIVNFLLPWVLFETFAGQTFQRIYTIRFVVRVWLGSASLSLIHINNISFIVVMVRNKKYSFKLEFRFKKCFQPSLLVNLFHLYLIAQISLS